MKMMAEAIGVGIGYITSKQDIETHRINVLCTIPAFIAALLLYPLPAVAFMAGVGFLMGKLMEYGGAWREGDTWLLAAYSALTLNPVLVLTGALSIYIIYYTIKGAERTLPFAPFLFGGFLLTALWRWAV